MLLSCRIAILSTPLLAYKAPSVRQCHIDAGYYARPPILLKIHRQKGTLTTNKALSGSRSRAANWSGQRWAAIHQSQISVPNNKALKSAPQRQEVWSSIPKDVDPQRSVPLKMKQKGKSQWCM